MQVLPLARRAGALHVGRVAVDGSKAKANALKHEAMSYSRMQEREATLAQEVHHVLNQAEATVAHRDGTDGSTSSCGNVSAELRRRETRLARIREANRALEARARAAAKAEQKPEETAKPEPRAQDNSMNPESQIMTGPDGCVQGYNAQIVVHPAAQVNVGQAVTPDANAKRQLQPMIGTRVEQSGEHPTQVLAHSEYCSDDNPKYVAAEAIDAYVATEPQKHTDPVERCPRGPLRKTATVTDQMQRKLQTKWGHAVYRSRKAIVEPVFGQTKHRRGFRQFLLRGSKEVHAEWALICLGHSVLKLHGLLCT